MADERTNQRNLDAEPVGRVFRQLSEEHIETKRRDDPDVIWEIIRARTSGEQTWRLTRGSKEPSSPEHSSPRLSQPSRRSNSLLGWGMAAAFVLFGVLIVSFWPSSQLSYVVESDDGSSALLDTSDAAEGRLLATEALRSTVQFSDRSQITLEPHTTLRLRVKESGQVVARLTQGKMSVHVEHHEETDYRFHAGPYEVRVIGTAFSLSYEPKTMKMHLHLTEGNVVVRDQAGGTKKVAAGQQLRLPEVTEAPSSPALPAEENTKDTTPSEQESAEKTAEQPAAKPSFPSYRALARKGKFAEIVSAARREGVDHVLNTKSAFELNELAQAARYTGNLRLAVKVFEHLRARHSNSSPGTNAPFFLGRIAEESGNWNRALALYGRYLGNSSSGLYAAEALGRKMNLIQKTQGPQAARSVAQKYVRRFPDGPYHTLAQSLLQRTPSP